MRIIFAVLARHHSQKFINSAFDFGKFYENGHNLANCIKAVSGDVKIWTVLRTFVIASHGGV